jgi:hypothetical protein
MSLPSKSLRIKLGAGFPISGNWPDRRAPPMAKTGKAQHNVKTNIKISNLIRQKDSIAGKIFPG